MIMGLADHLMHPTIRALRAAVAQSVAATKCRALNQQQEARMSLRNAGYVSMCLFMLAACGTATAAEPVTGFYIGGNAGQSRVSVDTAGINATVIAVGGVATAVTTADETDTGFKVFGGYRFHRNFAVEGGYFNLGRFEFTSVTTGPAVTVPGRAKNDNGFNLDVVGIVPFSDNFSLFGRAGVQTSKTSISGAPAGGFAFSSSETKTSFKGGAGLQFDFTRNFGARLEWERYRVPGGYSLIGKQNVDLFSLGLVLSF